MHGSKDLIHLANLSLVLQVQWGIEVGDLIIGAFADQFALTRMHEAAQLCQTIKRDVASNEDYTSNK